MSENNLVGMLRAWEGSTVTVVNPESFKSTQLGRGLTFQTYPAKLAGVGEDIIKLTFTATKENAETAVEQIIPLLRIKRISQWGDERFIHL